jgi:hypothetical protein
LDPGGRLVVRAADGLSRRAEMYTVLRAVPLRRLAIEQAPPALMALALAETLFKFHSFTLECTAFLATWYAIDFALDHVRRRWERLTSLRR